MSSCSTPPASPTCRGFDAVFQHVGGRGLYQWRLLAIVSIQMMVLTFHHLGFVFLGAVPKHWCAIDELGNSGWTAEQIRNISIPVNLISNEAGESEWNECYYYDLNYTKLLELHPDFEDAWKSAEDQKHIDGLAKCDTWTYDTSIYQSTVVSKFDLVCERRPLVATIQASYMGGVLVGSLILSSLSDRVFGRRRITLAAIAIVVLAGLAAAFAPTYSVFVTFRFLLAVGVAGSFQSCYVLLLEYTGPSCRALLGVVEQLPFAIGSMLIPVLAYFFRDWAHLQLAFTLSALSLLSYVWILPESCRWLASRGKTDDAIKLLEDVARVNSREKPNLGQLRIILEGCREKHFVQTEFSIWKSIQAPLTNVYSLLKTSKLRNRSLALWTLYFSVTVIYYGLSFLSVRMPRNPYVLFFLSGLMEVPAYCGITVPIVSRYGRKFVIITSFFVTALALFGLAFTPFEFQTTRILLNLCGKLFVSCGFAIIYLLGAELYPTTIRTTGLGSAVVVGRFGSMVAPYFVDIKSTAGMDNLPVMLFGCVAIAAAGVGFTLPDTRSMDMPDNIDDVESSSPVPPNGHFVHVINDD